MAVIALLGATAAGCSADTARFAEGGPLYAPSTDNQRAILGGQQAQGQGGFQPSADTTGSIPPATSSVRRAVLPPLPVAQAPVAPQVYANQPIQQPMPQAVARPEPVRVASAAGASIPAATESRAGTWSAAGGTYVTMAQGENLDVLSKRYGVPTNAILQVNNWADASKVTPGAQVLIPTYMLSNGTVAKAPPPPTPALPMRSAAATTGTMISNGVSGAAGAIGSAAKPTMKLVTGAQPAAAAPIAAAPVRGASHEVAAGETLEAIAHKFNVSKAALIAANGLKSDALHKGQKLVIPAAAKTAAVAPAAAAPIAAKPVVQAAAKPVAVTAKPTAPLQTAAMKPAAPAQTASIAPAKPVETKVASIAPTAPVAAPQPENVAVAKEPAADETDARHAAEPARTTPSFRWPVRGRVIGEFGSKPGAERNDGINLAVPEGTSVKAAEDGEVIYSGNELKGYGNLVLIRHTDGWVSAYAHNSELLVNRGDKVTRGQIVSRAGATGSVTQPQLHFELRRGQKPVDPKPYLASN